jgi:hypothetical protein
MKISIPPSKKSSSSLENIAVKGAWVGLAIGTNTMRTETSGGTYTDMVGTEEVGKV